MPRSGSATTKQSASALRRSSTLPNDRRGSKVSFGAALQVQLHATSLDVFLVICENLPLTHQCRGVFTPW